MKPERRIEYGVPFDAKKALDTLAADVARPDKHHLHDQFRHFDGYRMPVNKPEVSPLFIIICLSIFIGGLLFAVAALIEWWVLG